MKKLIIVLLALCAISVNAKEKIRVICVGASITEGYGTAEPKYDSYPAQLGKILGEDYEVLNFGKGGCTMLRHGSYPYWTKGPLAEALKSKPDIVFIDLGGNDSKGINRTLASEFEKDVRDMVNLFLTLSSHPRVILMTPAPSFVKDTTDIYDVSILRDIIPPTIRAAKAMGIDYLNIHPVLERRSDLFIDGIHPNALGSKMISEAMFQYIKNNLTLNSLWNNPILRDIYTADPSGHVWKDGRLYIYCSHDVCPPRGCDLMDRYHVFSTQNLVDWKDHGEILNSSQVKWGRKEGGFMWAPDCVYKNGKYYFYFPHPSGTDWNKTWKVGVAVSKYPDKRFKVKSYIKELGDAFAMIDPCVFIDDDGTPYFYYGGGGRCVAAKLKDNMMELSEPLRTMEGLVNFHEATWVFKFNGKYYLTYADGHSENGKGKNQLCYAMSDNPLGPWQYKGVYLSSTDCDTSHGSVVSYKGQWYQLYHNCSISHQGNLRSVCIDKLFFNGDGTIQMVRQTK